MPIHKDNDPRKSTIEIPLTPGWTMTTYGQITENFDSRRIPVKAKDRASTRGPYPYYGASGVIDHVDGYLFDGEYLLITEDGNLLSGYSNISFIASGKFWVNNHAHVVQSLGDIPLGYLEAHTNYLTLEPYVTGTTRPKLTQAALNLIPLPLPPLPEQHRIVAEIEKQFTRLDASVAALKRALANLKRYRASVLKAACEGTLVPTEAELARAEGRDYEPASVLLERILSERRARWESQDKKRGEYKEPVAPDTSELPELPEGWVWATVSQLSGQIEYGTSVKATYDSSGTPVLRMGNIQNGELDFENLKFLPPDDPEAQKTLLRPGDLLFNRTNSPELVGKSAVYKEQHQVACFASYLIRVAFLLDVSPNYVCTMLNSQMGRTYIAQVRSQQVGQANVNGTKLSAVPVPLPPVAEQHRIVAEVERRLSVIHQSEAAVEASLKRTERLRQSILKRAFSGQLVLQDPSDEPASVLLERIRAEREAAREAEAPKSRARRPKSDANGQGKGTTEQQLSLPEVP